MELAKSILIARCLEVQWIDLFGTSTPSLSISRATFSKAYTKLKKILNYPCDNSVDLVNRFLIGMEFQLQPLSKETNYESIYKLIKINSFGDRLKPINGKNLIKGYEICIDELEEKIE